MKKTVTLTIGLPGSGKTTWAKEQQSLNPNTVVVCRDDIREMFGVKRFNADNERLVAKIRDMLIEEAIIGGKNVIVADTNLSPRVRAHIRELFDSRVEVKEKSFLHVPLHECVKRDLLRERSVGKDVIHKMWRQHIAKPPKVLFDASLASAIIVNIDGTVAIKGPRSPYDYTKVHLDTPNSPVVNLVRRYSKDHCILFVSGREDSCRNETVAWLKANDIPMGFLFMRKAGDKRRGSIVKREVYENEIKGGWNISFVLDDRDQVVEECWRSLGLPTFQVNEGNF